MRLQLGERVELKSRFVLLFHGELLFEQDLEYIKKSFELHNKFMGPSLTHILSVLPLATTYRIVDK